MDETKFAVGQKVTILDVNKVGEVVAVTDAEGQPALYDVSYVDDAGATQVEKGLTADKLAAAGDAEEKADEGEGKSDGSEAKTDNAEKQDGQ